MKELEGNSEYPIMEQNMRLAGEVAEKFSLATDFIGGNTYFMMHRDQNDMTLVKNIEVRQVHEAYSDPFNMARGDNLRWPVQYSAWNSDGSEHTAEPMEGFGYIQGPKLKMPHFNGEQLTPQNLFRPFVHPHNLGTESKRRRLLELVVETGATMSYGWGGDILQPLRKDILVHCSSSAAIDTYVRLVDGLDDNLLGGLSRSVMTENFTRKAVNYFSRTSQEDLKTKEPVMVLSPNNEWWLANGFKDDREADNFIVRLENVGLLDIRSLSSEYSHRSDAFNAILHERLVRGEVRNILSAANKSPLSFTQDYMRDILVKFSSEPARNQQAATKILDTIREGKAYQTKVNFSNAVSLANQFSRSLNKNRDDHQLKPLSFQSITDLKSVGEAFFRLASATRSSDQIAGKQLAEDRMHAETIDMLLEPAIARELGRKVITVGDLIGRYPSATPSELTVMMDALQAGSGMPDLTRVYTHIKRARGSERINRRHFKPGSGIVS